MYLAAVRGFQPFPAGSGSWSGGAYAAKPGGKSQAFMTQGTPGILNCARYWGAVTNYPGCQAGSLTGSANEPAAEEIAPPGAVLTKNLTHCLYKISSFLCIFNQQSDLTKDLVKQMGGL